MYCSTSPHCAFVVEYLKSGPACLKHFKNIKSHHNTNRSDFIYHVLTYVNSPSNSTLILILLSLSRPVILSVCVYNVTLLSDKHFWECEIYSAIPIHSKKYDFFIRKTSYFTSLLCTVRGSD